MGAEEWSGAIEHPFLRRIEESSKTKWPWVQGDECRGIGFGFRVGLAPQLLDVFDHLRHLINLQTTITVCIVVKENELHAQLARRSLQLVGRSWTHGEKPAEEVGLVQETVLIPVEELEEDGVVCRIAARIPSHNFDELVAAEETLS